VHGTALIVQRVADGWQPRYNGWQYDNTATKQLAWATAAGWLGLSFPRLRSALEAIREADAALPCPLYSPCSLASIQRTQTGYMLIGGEAKIRDRPWWRGEAPPPALATKTPRWEIEYEGCGHRVYARSLREARGWAGCPRCRPTCLKEPFIPRRAA
jgi:hypothetical protein